MQGFTSLETLNLSSLLVPDLRCIWKGIVPCNLTTLKVIKCKKLTHVFTNNMIASLIQLKILEISNCEELEQIIAKDNDDENDKILSRSDIHSSGFSLGCYDFLFPHLKKLKVDGCPKLTTESATTSNHSMSAQSEVLLI